jgi:hypothetical protein
MTKEQLAPWIEKLTKASPKDYTAIVGEMCKENSLKAGNAWKLLKEAGFDSKAKPPANDTPQGNDQQGGDTPDNTGADSGSAGTAKPPGNTPPADETKQGAKKQGNENPPNPPASGQKPAKKRIKHEHLQGKNLIVGNKTIAFDADGIAELDAADAERLLTIPGYTEVKE